MEEKVQVEIVLPKHPTMRILTIFFKFLSLASYLLLNWISEDAILTFILVSLFAALDFWVVKNITGRKLVGLRWWNEFQDDGSETWVFESYDSNFKPEKVNSSFFWSSQILLTIVWLVFTVANLLTFRFFWVFKFSYLVCFIGFGLFTLLCEFAWIL